MSTTVAKTLPIVIGSVQAALHYGVEQFSKTKVVNGVVVRTGRTLRTTHAQHTIVATIGAICQGSILLFVNHFYKDTDLVEETTGEIVVAAAGTASQ